MIMWYYPFSPFPISPEFIRFMDSPGASENAACLILQDQSTTTLGFLPASLRLNFFLWMPDRDSQVKSASRTQFTLNPGLTTMSFGDGFNDCQTKACSLLFILFPTLNPVKFFKQPLLINWGNSDPAVFYFKNNPSILHLVPDPDLPSLLIKVNRVIHQIAEGLLEQRFISRNKRNGLVGWGNVEDDLLLVGSDLK